jgi:phage anti-repressor protein
MNLNIDIVQLIENNPITKLNGNYHSKLIEKVKNEFSEFEHQMFVSNFYCYLNNDFNNDFVINMDNIWYWLGFGQKANAKRLLENHFTVDEHYKIILEETISTKKEHVRGGHNKESIMLSVNTFKKLCLKAGTKKADQIHNYFIKIETLLQDIMSEESNELRLQLEQQKTEMQKIEETQKQEYNTKLEKERFLEREKILLREYASIGSIFYVIKVKSYENGSYVIKIGESRRGIAGRYQEHKKNFDECLLLDCFSVNKSKDFETFIKEHELVRGSRVRDMKGHEKELELFFIGKNLSYHTLLQIINGNIKFFNDTNNVKLELENEQLKLMLEMQNTNNEIPMMQELLQTMKQMSSKIDHLETMNKEILEKLQRSQVKTTTGFQTPLVTLGPRLQKIHPETLTILKVYETVTEAMKEDQNIKRPSINKAITENTIYAGYRWQLVDRELDPNIIYNISPTKKTREQNLGYIAQVNKEKTEIINVYIDRKTAALQNEYESSSALDNPVKNGTLAKNNYYYQLYEKCDENLVQAFEEKHGKPLLYVNGIGQYDEQQILTREFACKYDCIRSLQMSDKTLAKILDKNIAYQGYFYKTIGKKIKMV